MRILLVCLLCIAVACQKQAHHQEADPTLLAELSTAIRKELTRLDDAPEAGPWIEEQALMLAMAALHEPERIESIRRGEVKSSDIQRQSGLLIRNLERKYPGSEPPVLLTHLHRSNLLDSEQQLLLYCLVIQAKQEADIDSKSNHLDTD